MVDDYIVNIIYEVQMEGEIDQKVLTDTQYKKAAIYSSKMMEKLINTNLTKKQCERLDKVDIAKNNLAMEYGRIAYLQGMKDGFQLSQILGGNQKPKSDY